MLLVDYLYIFWKDKDIDDTKIKYLLMVALLSMTLHSSQLIRELKFIYKIRTNNKTISVHKTDKLAELMYPNSFHR